MYHPVLRSPTELVKMGSPLSAVWKAVGTHAPGAVTGALMLGGEQEPARIVPDGQGGFTVEKEHTRYPLGRVLAGAGGGILGGAAIRALLKHTGALERIQAASAKHIREAWTPEQAHRMEELARRHAEGLSVDPADIAFLNKQTTISKLPSQLTKILGETAGSGLGAGLAWKALRHKPQPEAEG